ncbi:MAG: ATP-binding protein [Armatimonadetes bacterium]|nr:ATP-binding protein [Armatimonadota bacterium]
MASYHGFQIDSVLRKELKDKFDDFRFRGEALQLWTFLAEFIANGSTEFFAEWTDHGIRHIEAVCEHCNKLISEDGIKRLSAKDVFCLCTAILLHDIAMRLDHRRVTLLLSEDGPFQEYKSLWDIFCNEAYHWDADKREELFGELRAIPSNLSFNTLLPEMYPLVGEFLRRHHGRIAQDIALSGFSLLTNDGKPFPRLTDYPKELKELIDLSANIAKSHTEPLREAADEAVSVFSDQQNSFPATKIIAGVHVAYLMALLRIADYLDFRNSSSQHFLGQSVRFSSPISRVEHQTMEAFRELQWEAPKLEVIYLQFSTAAPNVFINMQRYAKGLQLELDASWAVLSEHYAYSSSDVIASKGLTARRILALNLDNRKLNEAYHEEQLSITVSDSSIIFLLAGPLYNNDPRFSLREILSNAHDACSQANAIRETGSQEPPLAMLIDEVRGVIEFRDRGIGMSFEDVKNYFLRVGGRIRDSLKWKVDNISIQNGISYPYSSRFGVGVVSLFQIGRQVEISTKAAGHPSVSLTIEPTRKNILARKEERVVGTTIRIAAYSDVLALLSRFGPGIKLLSKALSESSHMDVLLQLVQYAKFVPTTYGLQIVHRKAQSSEEVYFPSIDEVLTSCGLSWSPLHEGAAEITVGQIGPLHGGVVLVVYNGIPIEVESHVGLKLGHKYIVVVRDPSNKLDFNLQKTEFANLPSGYIEDCLRDQIQHYINATLRSSNWRQLFTGGPARLWHRGSSLIIAEFQESSRAKAKRGVMPLLFWKDGQLMTLTKDNLETQHHKVAFVILCNEVDLPVLCGGLPDRGIYIVCVAEGPGAGAYKSPNDAVVVYRDSLTRKDLHEGRVSSSDISTLLRHTGHKLEMGPSIEQLTELCFSWAKQYECDLLVVDIEKLGAWVDKKCDWGVGKPIRLAEDAISCFSSHIGHA